MQNLAKFQTTSNFGSEYLWNGYRYSKLDKYVIDCGFPAFSKKSPVTTEIWWSNCTHPKCFLWKTIFWPPRCCCAPKFFHALENDQVLLAHTPPGTVVPLTIFYSGDQKLA